MNSGNVVSIAPAQVDAACVQELREMLAQAEEGKIVGIAAVTLRSDKEVGWCVSGREATCNYLRLHGLLGWLQRRLLERWESGSNVLTER